MFTYMQVSFTEAYKDTLALPQLFVFSRRGENLCKIKTRTGTHISEGSENAIKTRQ